jgi:uncharacterized membrane protein YphA (DoxX/SURF4 family)
MKSLAFILVFLLLITSVTAHVAYVLTDEQLKSSSGQDELFLLRPFDDLMNVALMVIASSFLIIAYIIANKIPLYLKKVEQIKEKAKTYVIYIPWIARLGVGIALIGAGTEGALISPVFSAPQIIATLEILIGFMILAGLLLGIAAAAAIGLYALGLAQGFSILGNLDFLALATLILCFGNSAPGVDDLLGIPSTLFLGQLKKYSVLFVRIGIGFAMVFLAIHEKFLNPHLSELVVTQYGLNAIIPVSVAMWVLSAGLIELVVGSALLIGYKTRIFAAIAFIVLSASFFFFKESVYSHITLFASLSILFITDRSLEQ